MVDVTHDGDHRRARLELLCRIVGDRRCLEISGVLLFLDRLESELASNELDLIEVETLVDRYHQAEILERESNDLHRRRLENLRQLTDGNELVDADGLF